MRILVKNAKTLKVRSCPVKDYFTRYFFSLHPFKALIPSATEAAFMIAPASVVWVWSERKSLVFTAPSPIFSYLAAIISFRFI